MGSGKYEVGSTKWEVRPSALVYLEPDERLRMKWEVGSGKYEGEVGSTKWEVRNGKYEVGSAKFEVYLEPVMLSKPALSLDEVSKYRRAQSFGFSLS